MMRWISLIAPLAFACLSTAAPADPHDRVMDEIERAIVMPDGAEPLSAYGRSYAYDGPNKVMAIYLIPQPPSDPDTGCEVMTSDLGSRPCTAEEVENSIDSEREYDLAQVPAGERRWLSSVDALPLVNDGGCSVLIVRYDLSTHRILLAACNGPA